MQEIWDVSGIPPAALASKPEKLFWMHAYIEAFELLSSRRSFGMGPNPLSLEAMDIYFTRFMFDDYQEFIALMCKMDVIFMGWWSRKNSKASQVAASGKEGK